MPNYNQLTPEEAHVILEKGTEPPYSGEYDKFTERGIYLCRQCNTPLFTSEMKFDAGCGWPSFEDAIPGRIKWLLDADGRRTEITCATCGAHLGHVFIGEHLTEKNTRHCVNSLSMKFTRDSVDISNYKRAYFGGGCFWCMDAIFSRLEGVLEVRSGYMGGKISYPTYERVCSGTSGYIEIVEIFYEPEKVSYETLLDVFFSSHDPTSMDKQGNDSGEQYRSVIFGAQEDLEKAKKYIEKIEGEEVFDQPIVTELRPVEAFYMAEDYHQGYYANHPTQAYCQYIIDPKIRKLRERFQKYLKKNEGDS